MLPKSRSPQRLKENLDLGHLDLTAAEMEVIRGLDQVRRIGVLGTVVMRYHGLHGLLSASSL